MTLVSSALAADRMRSAPQGMLYASGAMALFGLQDALTKYLVGNYPIAQFLLVRFGVFAVFALVFAASQGGVRAAFATRQPAMQITRSVLLLIDILLFCVALQWMSIGDLHAVYATTPLMVTLLVGPLLGEFVGWRRRTAVAVGFLGALIIIRPGLGVMHWAALIVIASGFFFALYTIATRKVSAQDSLATSTLYTALGVTLLIAPFGVAQWQPIDLNGALAMGGISLTGILGHMLYMRSLALAPAIVLQPLTYMLLVWAVFYGFTLFHTLPDGWTVLGAVVVVLSGLYVSWREWVRSRDAAPASPV
jgi:drug/metabolite transporter (DMT)-like permease